MSCITFAEDDRENISKPVPKMYVILNVFLIVNMKYIFSTVSIQEKQAIRKIESIGKDLIRTNAAVTFNQICIDT